jgi:outer membrane protein assembly factor BamB
LAWKFRTGGAVISSPAIDESGVIYFTSVNGFFYALNPNGTQRWRLRTGGYTDSSPVIGKDGVLHVGVNTNVVAISRKGEKLSSRQMHDLILGSPLAFADGSWCAISRYGLMVGETAGKTSSERTWLWSYYTYGSGYSSPVAGTDGTIYVYGKQDGMALIALEASEPLAKTPWPKFRKNFQNTAR